MCVSPCVWLQCVVCTLQLTDILIVYTRSLAPLPATNLHVNWHRAVMTMRMYMCAQTNTRIQTHLASCRYCTTPCSPEDTFVLYVGIPYTQMHTCLASGGTSSELYPPKDTYLRRNILHTYTYTFSIRRLLHGTVYRNYVHTSCNRMHTPLPSDGPCLSVCPCIDKDEEGGIWSPAGWIALTNRFSEVPQRYGQPRSWEINMAHVQGALQGSLKCVGSCAQNSVFRILYVGFCVCKIRMYVHRTLRVQDPNICRTLRVQDPVCRILCVGSCGQDPVRRILNKGFCVFTILRD